MHVHATCYERMLWPNGNRRQTRFGSMTEALELARWRKQVWKDSIAVRVVRHDTGQEIFKA